MKDTNPYTPIFLDDKSEPPTDLPHFVTRTTLKKILKKSDAESLEELCDHTKSSRRDKATPECEAAHQNLERHKK